MKTYFTSESVTLGHPDKVCDEIADAILDEILRQDKNSHVACEVTVVPNKVHIFGEVTTSAKVDYEKIARKTICKIGYTERGRGFDGNTCHIELDLHEQSPEIAMGVNKKAVLDSGAGDQGIMFGYACDETENFMPLPIELAHRLTKALEKARINNIIPYLLPDGKAQVTVEYEEDVPKRISTVIVSAQHREGISIEEVRNDILEKVIFETLPKDMLDDKTMYFINPTGKFTIGGPAADSGLTGRKIVVDTYGGYGRHGGGSFSGKDPTKVDRTGAYMARYIAKNIVAAGFAKKCEVQISYSIGLADPTSLMINTFGTETIPVEEIQEIVENTLDLRPAAIINYFGLRRPIYSKISCYGHFGENAKNMPWEQTGGIFNE